MSTLGIQFIVCYLNQSNLWFEYKHAQKNAAVEVNSKLELCNSAQILNNEDQSEN